MIKSPIKNIKKEKTHKSGKIQKLKTTIVQIKEINETVQPLKNIIKVKSKKKVKYVMPSKYITEGLVNSCLDALQQLTIHYNKKNKIFEDETPVFAEINCIKIQNRRGNIKFVLPHSTVATTGEVCLITPDLKKGKNPDHEPTIDHWEEILRKAGVTSVKTILPLRQLRVEYDQYELKRRLLTQHDFIMVDTRVLNHASHVLGNIFFKKNNMLIPVRINLEGDIKKDVDVGLRTAMLRLNEGPTSTIIIGHTGMPQQFLKENIISLVQQLRDRYPGGESNIRSINIKLPLSLSVPLYLTLRPSNTVNVPKLIRNIPKHSNVVEDELSTIPNSVVRVTPEGTVCVKKMRNKNKKMKETNETEEEN